jgi:5'-nucleotidase / UDP-sugar diphosphatase
LHVDAGHLFSDDTDFTNPELLRSDAILGNGWMLKGFSKFKFDAANLSNRDLRYCGLMLAKDKYEERVKETPLVGEMISANMIAATDLNTAVAPKPYLIREVEGKRFPNGKSMLKVGFIGLTQPGPGGKVGLIIQEPLKKIKEVLPEVRKQADLVVVLAYMPADMAKQMAKENPDIDMIIGANGTHPPPPAVREGKTIIVYADNQTKSLGEVRLYFNSEGQIGDYINRYISLDSSIPSQAEASKINDLAKAEVEAEKTKVFGAAEKAAENTQQQPSLLPKSATPDWAKGAKP